MVEEPATLMCAECQYCTILNRQDFNEGMTGDEYEEINDLLIEVEEFLNL